MYKGDTHCLSSLFLKVIILHYDTDPFDLTPIVLSSAKEFDREAANAVPPFEEDAHAVTHGDGGRSRENPTYLVHC